MYNEFVFLSTLQPKRFKNVKNSVTFIAQAIQKREEAGRQGR